MNRQNLEHISRASSAITNEYEIVIIGSQALLGAVPHPPAELMESMEADVYPLRHPELADLIDGSIGEGSIFHDRSQTGGRQRKRLAFCGINAASWVDTKRNTARADRHIGYCCCAKQ